MTNRYDVGDLVRLSVEFKDLTGAFADPSSVVVKYLAPGGTAQSITYPTDIVKQGTGLYYYDLSITTSGTWSYRWEGTGTVTAATEATLIAKTTAF